MALKTTFILNPRQELGKLYLFCVHFLALLTKESSFVLEHMNNYTIFFKSLRKQCIMVLKLLQLLEVEKLCLLKSVSVMAQLTRYLTQYFKP